MLKVHITIVILTACIISLCAADCTLGTLANNTVNVPLIQIIKNPTQYAGKVIRTYGSSSIAHSLSGNTGHVLEVYNKGTGVVYVSSQDEFFSFPVLEHEAAVNVMIDGYVVLNWIGNDTRLDPIAIVEIQAVGITFITNDDVCQGSPDPVIVKDLRTGSLHGHGIGAGYVCLQPGEEMHIHSTQDSSEIVNVISGDAGVVLTVYIGQRAIPYKVLPFNSIYLGRGTVHGVKNVGTVQAWYVMMVMPYVIFSYVYVHADVRNE